MTPEPELKTPEALKSCPFCGGAAMVHSLDSDPPLYLANCMKCMRGSAMPADRWNTRAPDPRIKELELQCNNLDLELHEARADVMRLEARVKELEGIQKRLSLALDAAHNIGIFPQSIAGLDGYDKRSDYQEGWNAAVMAAINATIQVGLWDGDWLDSEEDSGYTKAREGLEL